MFFSKAMEAAAAAAAGPAITPVKRRLVGSPGLPSPEKSNYAKVVYSLGASSTKLVQIQGDANMPNKIKIVFSLLFVAPPSLLFSLSCRRKFCI